MQIELLNPAEEGVGKFGKFQIILYIYYTMRKTSKDYRRELKDLREKIESLESHVRDRVLKLSKEYPDAVVWLSENGDVLYGRDMIKEMVGGMAPEGLIEIIHMFEDHNASKQPYIQKTIYD